MSIVDATSLRRGDDSAFDLVVIATKAQHVPEALRVAAKLIEKGGPAAGILLIQNGIGTTKGRYSDNTLFGRYIHP